MITKKYCIVQIINDKNIKYCLSETYLNEIKKQDFDEFESSENLIPDFISTIKSRVNTKKIKLIIILSENYILNRTQVPFSNINKLNKIISNLIENQLPLKPENFRIGCIKPFKTDDESDELSSIAVSVKKEYLLNLIDNFLSEGIDIVKITVTAIETANCLIEKNIFDTEKNFQDNKYNISLCIKAAGRIDKISKVFSKKNIETDEDSEIKYEDLMLIALKTVLNKKKYFNLNLITSEDKTKYNIVDNTIPVTTYYYLSGLIGIILLLLFINLVFKLYLKKNTYESLKISIRNDFKSFFPNIKHIVKPESQAKNELLQKEKELKNFYSYSTYKTSFTNTLNRIMDVLNNNNVTIDMLEYTDREIKLSGVVQSFTGLDRVKMDLLKLNNVTDFKIYDSKIMKVLKGEEVRFNSDILFGE